MPDGRPDQDKERPRSPAADGHVPIERGTPEWDAAWALLAGHIRAADLGDGGDLAQENEFGEAWQLLCATRDGDAVVHEFRHRDHPATGRREHARLRSGRG